MWIAERSNLLPNVIFRLTCAACSRRNSVLQQQHSSLRIIQPEQTAGDAACVHGRHPWWVSTGMQYTTAWSRMDERGNVPRDIRREREANVGETCEDAGRVPWKRYRVFVGGMTVDHRVKSPVRKNNNIFFLFQGPLQARTLKLKTDDARTEQHDKRSGDR